MSGPAVLHTRRGVYVCEHAELCSGGVVTYRGQRRERDYQGDRLYAPHTRSIRLGAGEWVEWAATRPQLVPAIEELQEP